MAKFGKSLSDIIDPLSLDWDSSSNSDMSSFKLKGNTTEENLKLILRNTAKVLQFLHSANVVHRNISPKHILVDSACNVRICGFSYARSLPESLVGKGSGNSRRVRSPLRN